MKFEDYEIEEATNALNLLKEAQDNLLSVMFEINDDRNLQKAFALIGDTMNGISETYGLSVKAS